MGSTEVTRDEVSVERKVAVQGSVCMLGIGWSVKGMGKTRRCEEVGGMGKSD